MCRMFGYYGHSREEFKEFMDSLREVSQKDLRDSGKSHGDGWGMVVFYPTPKQEGKGFGEILHFRTSTPIYKDDYSHLLGALREGEFFAIVHARWGDSPSVSSIFNHPFYTPAREYFLFMAHNGKVESKEILGDGYLETDLNPETSVDTEIVLEALREKGEGILSRLRERTVTALNLIVLQIPRSQERGKPRMWAYTYYKNTKKKDYYHLYSIETPKGRAVVSSSICDVIQEECKELHFGQIEELVK